MSLDKTKITSEEALVQSRDSFGPGEVTEVNLWSRVLSGGEIAAQKANCHITQAGLNLWWEQFKDKVYGVKIVES